MSDTIASQVGRAIGNYMVPLLVTLVVLKLYGLISTSWLWVLSPLWIPLALAVIGVLIWAANKLVENA